MDLLLLLAALGLILWGVPVAFALGGAALLFAGVAIALGAFDPFWLRAVPGRLFALAESRTLVAIPLFVLMGTLLERGGIARDLVASAAHLMRRVPGGLPVAVTLVGLLLAAATGVVGASVIALGLVALPAMLRAGVAPARAAGTVAAAGTLGQIVPPSIVLLVLADQLGAAFSEAQTAGGGFASDTLTVADLFAGAALPGVILAMAFCALHLAGGRVARAAVDPPPRPVASLLLPLGLVVAVLGSILSGFATAAEAASVGACGAFLMVLARPRPVATAREALGDAVRLTGVVFAIVVGASVFALVFRALGGDDTVRALLEWMPGGAWGAVLFTMALVFLLGFVLEFLEIAFVVVPLAAPVLLAMEGVDPVWLGVLIALNLQTSFLTPPFGVALFYLRSVAPPSVTTAAIWRGVVPFVLIQLAVLLLVFLVPALATALPNALR